MSYNVNDFNIQCINRKKEIINLHMKNMPDCDELANIIRIDKKLDFIDCILFAMAIVLTFTFIISSMFFFTPRAKSSLACVYMIILISVYAFYFLLLGTIKTALKKRIVIRKSCDYIWKYMEVYSDPDWDDLMANVRGAQALIHIPFAKFSITNNDPLQDLDDMSISITFSKSFFALDLEKHMCEIFWVKDIISDCKLENDTMEFDFLKNELRVPMKFAYDDKSTPGI